MHILIGLAMGVALLYWWLLGNWFARVLVFLLFACGGFLGGVAIGAQSHDQSSWLVLGIIGAGLAWPLAGLPVYFWRWRIQQMMPTIYR